MKSGPIGNKEVTWMRRTVSGASTRLLVSYRQRSGGEVFTFYRGGKVDVQASSMTVRTVYSASVSFGSPTLRRESANNGRAPSHGDAVRIDDLEVGVDGRVWTDSTR